jgi:8-oxo-dGTP pyrophosphatase MutT (NUDIX family)
VLTRRSAKLKSHRAQIGFAGGRQEPGESLVETVLRESEEELGIGISHFSVHGFFSEHSSYAGDLVYPVLMSAEVSEQDFAISRDEVDELLLVEWPHLVPQNDLAFSFNLFGVRRYSHLFQYDGHSIWGMTAKMIVDLGLKFQ